MARVLIATVLAALALTSGAAATPPVRLKDGQLRDPQGRQVVLHGFNIAYKLAPYLPNDSQGERTSFDADDVARLRGWGFNTIRLGVTWKALMPERGKIDQTYLRQLIEMTRLAARGGLFVLVDMHQDEWSERYRGNGAPEWATYDDGIPFPPTSPGHPYDYAQPAVGRAFTSFWENREGIRTEYVRAFTALAKALRREPGVIGYDAFNEPSCELARSPCGLPPQNAAGGKWLQPFYDELIPAMNAADTDSPVFFEDFLLTFGGYPWTVGVAPNPPWPYRGQGLSYHIYCPHPLRQEEADCPTLEREAADDAAAEASLTQTWPLLTEFGATDDLAVLRRIVAYADELGHGWQYWQYKTYFDPSTSARSNPTASADAESLVAEDGTTKQAKLKVLARAYPERIAGTGPKWSFDDTQGRFEFEWTPTSTKRQTVVSLPLSVHYPKGYVATARGARIVGRKGAPRLRLRGLKRGQQASVTVLPR